MYVLAKSAEGGRVCMYWRRARKERMYMVGNMNGLMKSCFN